MQHNQDMKTKGERREAKRRQERKMLVHGRSVFTVQRLLVERATALGVQERT